MKPLPSSACVALLLLAGCGSGRQDAAVAEVPEPAEATPAGIDTPAVAEAVTKPAFPTLTVSTVDGEAYDLAERRGTWVIVNFWATWCSPCLKEMPELSELAAANEHIEVIGLAYEEIGPEAMKAFLEKHPVEYPVAILDVYDPPADFDTPRGLPMTYLIAPDGKVARQFLGPVTGDEIQQAIAASGGPEFSPETATEPAGASG